MSKPLRIALLIVLIIALMALGYFRDWLFVNVNGYLGFWKDWWVEVWEHPELLHGPDNPTDPTIKGWLSGYTFNQIWYGKWMLTIVFTVAYFLLSSSIGWVLFQSRKFILLLFWAFAAIVAISAVSYGIGYLISDLQTGYNYARIFMDFVQSPLVLMILIPAFYLRGTTRLASPPTDEAE